MKSACLSVLLFLITLAGCGSTTTASDRVASECSYLTASDRETFIDLMQLGKDAGDSKETAAFILGGACVRSDCFGCVNAVIDLVYGN